MAKQANVKAKSKQKQRKRGMAKLGIQWRMLLLILPVVIIALNVVSLVSGNMSSAAINEQTTKFMESELDANVNDIDGKLEKIRTSAETLATVVGDTYKYTNLMIYKNIFSDVVTSNDMVIGAGIWFEPKVYTGDMRYSGEEYCGPYWYADGDEIVEDWEYSNAEYDYFSQEYYLNAKAQTSVKAVITDPYYDEASDSIMASCSCPVFNRDNKYLGCITVDLGLDAISTMVGGIKVGNSGSGIMTAADGTYIYTEDMSKVSGGMKISDETSGIGTIANEVLGNESGNTSFKSYAGKINAYYETVPEVGWKLLIVMPYSEINEPVTSMTRVTLTICVLSIIICVLLIFFIARSIAKTIINVNEFASELAAGNFTVDKLNIKRTDELGDMSRALNNMYESNSDIISNISSESGNVNDSATTLSAMSQELTAEFSKIQTNMAAVNDSMMSSGAATEQVSASVQEVNTSVQDLAHETEETSQKVKEIEERAAQIQERNTKAHDNAISITSQRRAELEEANEKAKVVSQIEEMANSISAIASQINLLSLNASIEAARAGDAGKGFAVVASEINNLAIQTDSAVQEIKGTINDIQEAFADLSAGSNKLLDFVTDTVTPDYESFVDVGRQYGNDAELFGELASRISDMTDNIKASMNEVNEAIQSIAENTQDTANHSAEITDSVDTVSNAVESVADLAIKQQETAGNLQEIVSHFKLG